VSKQKHCAPCWNVCSDDRAAGGNAHLDRGGSYQSETRFHGTERDGADGSPEESVFRTCVCVPWTAGRSDQDVAIIPADPEIYALYAVLSNATLILLFIVRRRRDG